MKRPAYVMLGIMLLVLIWVPVLNSKTDKEIVVRQAPEMTLSYVEHEPIHIYNDSEFAEMAS